MIENRHLFSDFYLTVQQEFAERIVATAGGKDYSSFSCFNQFYTHAQSIFKIKRSAFKPSPKVDSCFLKLSMRQSTAYACEDEKFLFHVIRSGFGQRRKTLVNALSAILPKEQLIELISAVGLPVHVRAEKVSLDQFILLADRIQKFSSPLA